MSPEEIKNQLSAENEDALTADGFDAALVGITYQFGRPPVACYDYEKCIKILMERDGMDQDDAIEFFEFNTVGAWMGESTPVFTKLFT
jgi:hypothetical protein